MFNENTALIIFLIALIALFVFMLLTVSANSVPYVGVIITALSVVATQLVRDEISLSNRN